MELEQKEEQHTGSLQKRSKVGTAEKPDWPGVRRGEEAGEWSGKDQGKGGSWPHRGIWDLIVIGKCGFVRRAEKRRKQCFKKEQLRGIGGGEEEECRPVFLKCEGKLVILVGICYFCRSPSIYPISGKRSLFPSGEASFFSITTGKQFDSFISKP